MIVALAGALLAVTAPPAQAATSSLDVPTTASAPSLDPHADETSFDRAAVAQVGWNSTKSAPATEDTAARIETDGKYLYVRFDASQQERIVSAQPHNGTSSGDLVWIDLQPGGAQGTDYRFSSSPDGSSEATASSGTAPSFDAAGAPYPGGYTVTMKIPLAPLHSAGGSGPWNMQVGRTIAGAGTQCVWSHDGNVAQAGTITLPASVGILP
jgi:hypothetical protein